ncbi:ABC transporter substrate-binding protein [Desulforamulus putei]|uniref:ABC transporter substrate-binding protein n=1 Tax=Desulforamulus putei TaxID=74701 RepID=UPI002FDD67AA
MFRFLNRKKLLLLVSFVLVTGLIFTGCGKTSPNQTAQEEGEQSDSTHAKIPVYTIADSTGDWGYPTPYSHYQRGPGYIRMSFIFDTLVWKDDKGFIPALAKKWEYIEGENAYYFELDEKARWHDGQKFTARDVAFTFDYTREHPYAWVDTTKIDRVEIIDDYKVKIYLKEKYAPFLNNVAGTLPIMPEHIWKQVEKPEEFKGPEAVIGTGPYKLVDYNKEQGTYLYEANPDYHLGSPRVEKLKFVKVGSEMATATLERGEVNFAQIPPELKDEVANKELSVIKTQYDWALKLLFNHQKEPFSAKEFRQALAYAIDREQLVKTTKRGYALAGKPGLLSPDSEWYNPNAKRYDYNPEKVKEILNGLGYELKNGYFVKNGQDLTVELLISPDYERDGQFIKQQLENAGIKVNLKSLEAKTLDSMVQDWKFDLALSGHGGLGGDAEILNKVTIGKGVTSIRYTENKVLTRLLKEQVAFMNPDERKAKVEKIQEIYAEELPCLTLYYPDWYYGYDGKIQLFNTKKGIGFGVPLPLNKWAFVR